MQQHDQRRARRQAGWHVGEHGKIARIGAEIRDRDQLSGTGRGDVVRDEIVRPGRGHHRGRRVQGGA